MIIYFSQGGRANAIVLKLRNFKIFNIGIKRINPKGHPVAPT